MIMGVNMKRTKFAIFILLNLFWLIIISGVIYTVYFLPIGVQSPEDPSPIRESFINLPFIMVMLLVIFSNILFFKGRDEMLSTIRKILFYLTSIVPTLLIIFAWLISSRRTFMSAYINYFGLYKAVFFGITPWIVALIIGVFCLFSFINISIKQKNTKMGNRI